MSESITPQIEVVGPPDLNTPEGIDAFIKVSNCLHPSDWVDQLLPPVEYVIDGIMDKGSLSMIAAEEGTGKSIVLTQMAHAIAAGGDFLARQCSRAPVIYYVIDEPLRNLKRRLQCQGLTTDTDFFILSELSADEITTERFIRSLELKIKAISRKCGEVPAIFLDTMADALDIEDLNSHSEVVGKLGQLRELIRRTGCTIVMTHHYNKNTQTNTRNRVTGSKGLRSKCDIVFDLTFSDPDDEQSVRTIRTSKVRITETLPLTMLDYDPNTFTVSASANQMTMREREEHERGELIVKLIGESEDGLGYKEIAAGTGISEKTLYPVIGKLKSDGSIVEGKRLPGKGGRLLFRLPDTAEQKELASVPTL